MIAGVNELLGEPVFRRLGWALVHFAWQGAAAALLLAAVLPLLRRRSANLRYLACCLALLVVHDI